MIPKTNALRLQHSILAAVGICATLAISACSEDRTPAPVAQAPTAKTSTKIAWYPHGVDEAFAEATETGKPVFLYWGAVWCPPCNQLKSTVFPRPDFVAKTQKFIPVYLDGDTEGAQRWGEHFGIVGYPTMLVLGGDRSEISRISGGLDVEQYPRLLDLALAATQPVAELLALAKSDPKALNAGDWERLALNGWPLDLGRTIPDEKFADTMSGLAASCPVPRWQRRFELLALNHLASRSKPPSTALVESARPPARAMLSAVLTEPRLLADNLQEIEYGAAAMIVAAAPVAAEREPLRQQLIKAMELVGNDPKLSTRERLLSVNPALELHKLEAPDAPLPKPVAEHIRDRAQWAEAQATTPQERQAVVVMAADLMHDVGFGDEAKAMLEADLEQAVQPNEHFLYLATWAEKDGDKDASLSLWRQGRDRAAGPASRTQWGIYYVDALVRLTPKDQKAIEAAATAVLDELGKHPDAYYQRTRQRLGGMATRLRAWADKNKADPMLARLQQRLDPVCKTVNANAEMRLACAGLLSG